MEKNELKSIFDDEDDDNDEDVFIFENGTWIWDTVENRLAFKAFTDHDKEQSHKQRTPSWMVKFKDEDNVLEQLRFTKKYQRKIHNGEPDVIILQDVKDVVLFTAPISLLNKEVINVLHTQAYDRFVRTLIVYTQYFLRVSKTLKLRIQEGRYKIRLPISDLVEKQWEDNLSDMRVIVAKEYFNFLHENHKSNHETESHFMEMLLRLTVQIIWISLNRTNFNIIDIEINRLVRGEAFNISFHLSKDQWAKSLTEREKITLFGKSFQTKLAKNYTFEDFLRSEKRMIFMEDYFCALEEEFTKLEINIGILGKHKKINESKKATTPKKLIDILSNLYRLLELPKTKYLKSVF
ncbi:uncharacterized protein LOC143917261 [Arctopsyche grandis]|uniref:uncharacterized protein LOC143917261 n=1 Tax=Arctopsyche grandis TaxID=121162 RepID=UPI00406D8888